MKLLKMISVLPAIVVLVSYQSTSVAAAQRDDDKKVTVTGCAVKGTGDSDGFLLANAVERTTVTTVAPTPTGAAVSSATATAMKPARILYWLDDDDDVVAKMMGHLVEITGEVEGDVKRGVALICGLDRGQAVAGDLSAAASILEQLQALNGSGSPQ